MSARLLKFSPLILMLSLSCNKKAEHTEAAVPVESRMQSLVVAVEKAPSLESKLALVRDARMDLQSQSDKYSSGTLQASLFERNQMALAIAAMTLVPMDLKSQTDCTNPAEAFKERLDPNLRSVLIKQFIQIAEQICKK